MRHAVAEEMYVYPVIVEDDQFPKLRTHIYADRLVEIGQQVEAAKKMAPARPHPHSELFHKLVGPGVGMVDRLRDKLMGRETG